MLYAEQHWTKAIDSKSAVEHLYEKLGALEFDADQFMGWKDITRSNNVKSSEKNIRLEESSNFSRELSDRFSKGIGKCNKYLNGNMCLKCLQIQLFSNNLEEYC
ncbi:hypothetical protein FQA39_LY14176 [Lamprigera yunnana]|nr:hypothetical protein FQA39_LY14176 [Lamprigera yunnana]